MEFNTNDLIWFENICQIITKNPAIATKTLEDFIKSDDVIEKCCIYLSSINITETGYFHALSCLHRAFIVKWNIIPAEIKKFVQSFLMNQLRSKLVIATTISNFGTNKLMQVFVSIWKRSWIDSDEDEKIVFFGFISELLRDKQTAIYATMILRIVIEEFSTQSYAECNIQYGFHINTKNSFQKNDLLKVFELAVPPLCTLLAIIKTSSNIGGHIPDLKAHMTLVSELSKLLVELLEWSFDDEYIPVKVDSSKLYRYSKLPREWHMYITSLDFIEVLFYTMQTLVQYPLNYQQHMGDYLYKNCMVNVRNLILHISCIDGEIFHSFELKMQFGNFFLNSLNVLLNPYCVRSHSNELLVTDNFSYDYVSGGIRQDMLDLFVNALMRFIGNYKLENAIKLSNFESSFMTFGLISLELSKEMSSLSVFLINEVDAFQKHLESSTSAGRLSSLPKQSEVLLFDTWRADILSSSLDLWSIMLDGSVISQRFCGLSTDDVNISTDFIQWLKKLNNEMFKLYSEVLMNNTIFETICEAEDENDEDGELIETRCIEDFFTGIGIIGRISFQSSLEDIYNSIYNNFNQLKATIPNTVTTTNEAIKIFLCQPFNNIKCLKYLEGCRIAVELLCYLLFENFHSKLTAKDSEKPRINTYILFFLSDGSNSFNKLLETCNLLVEVLSVQISYMTIYSVDFPMVSPILMHTIYHFFNELSACYVDVDPDTYESFVSSFFIEQLNSNLWNPLLLRLYDCSYQTILLLPLEVELIKMVSSCIQSIALSKNQARLQHILQFHSILEISNLISTTHIGGVQNSNYDKSARTLLNPSCLSYLFEAISTLFLNANAEAHFNQLLVNTHNALELQNGFMDSKVQFYHVISAMSGLAKCPKGFSSWLFDSSWSILRSRMNKYTEDSDDLLRQFLNLLLNIGEYQLLSLSNNSCMEVYRTTYEIMQLFSQRFQIVVTRSEEENLFKSELSILLLDVLNTLSIKDFEFFDDDKTDQFQSFENEISLILINGLEILLPLITVEILENYASIAERLFSFVSFLSGNYMVRLAQWINQKFQNSLNNSNSTTLHDLLSRLLWASSSVDGNVARTGFNSLQSLATHQWKCKFNRISNQDRIPLYQNDLLLQGVLEYFIQSIFFGNNQNAILSWDRIDSFANVLITLIALDIEYYNKLIQSYIETKFSSFEENKFHFIVNTLKHLSTDRNVDLQNIDKSNRMIFVLNFRDFVSQIKSTSFF